MNSRTEFDYLIVGAGPAGLQLGYFLGKSRRNYLILEAADRPGSFYQKLALHFGRDDRHSCKSFKPRLQATFSYVQKEYHPQNVQRPKIYPTPADDLN